MINGLKGDAPKEQWEVEYEAMALTSALEARIEEIEANTVNRPDDRIKIVKQALQALDSIMRVYAAGNLPNEDMWVWINTVRDKIFHTCPIREDYNYFEAMMYAYDGDDEKVHAVLRSNVMKMKPIMDRINNNL